MPVGAAIHLQSLTVMRGARKVLRDFSMVLPTGRFHLFIANNGAGKTTLLQTLAGLLTPLAGHINTADIHPHQIRYIGHHTGLWSHLRVGECLCYMLALKGVTAPQAVDTALAYFRLQHCRAQQVGRCSAGQKQRLALAVLKASPGKLWLLDEPWAALDKDAEVRLWDLLVQHLDTGGTVCATSHQSITHPRLAINPIRLPYDD